MGKYASMKVCKYAYIQVCKYANMQVCTYMQVCKYAHIYNGFQKIPYPTLTYFILLTLLIKAKRYICPQLRHFLFEISEDLIFTKISYFRLSIFDCRFYISVDL